jgi:Ca2+-binding RTX toxin-like protein
VGGPASGALSEGIPPSPVVRRAHAICPPGCEFAYRDVSSGGRAAPSAGAGVRSGCAMTITVTVTSPSPTGSDLKLVDFLRDGLIDPIDNQPTQFVALDPTLTLGSATEITLHSASGNLVFNPFGAVVSGTITGFSITSAADGIVRATVTGLNIDAAALYAAMIANDVAALDALLFGTDAFSYVGDTGNDVFTSGLLADHLDGGAGDDFLVARDGADTLVGAVGADTLDGGASGDTYELGANAAAIVILDSAGNDTVTSTISRSLAGFATVEGLTLLGSADIDGTGNSLANTIIGNAGDNVLDGGGGTDFLIGGNGDDTYVLGADNDLVAESNGNAGGIDTITSTITRTLVSLGGIENLTLEGSADIDGTGNNLDNVITGSAGDNLLDGGVGSDTLSGGDGDDTLMGGNDSDADTLMGGSGDDLYELGNNYGGICTDTSGTDTVTSTGTRSIAFFTGIENLVLLGNAEIDGTGNGLDNTITGNSGNNVLTGGLGLDTLIGGLGDDTYVFSADDDNDVIVDTGGTDTLISVEGASLQNKPTIENLILDGNGDTDGYGNVLDNVITGNSGDNALVGFEGADSLYGGAGDDDYFITFADDALDTIVDSSGTDRAISNTVSVSIAGYVGVENILLDGNANLDATGNALANLITGNNGANILDGGVGVDTLSGGTGSDTYVLGSESDAVVESFNAGTDTITSTITRSLAPYAHVERLTLLGGGNIDGTGNGLDNTITGNAGKNTLDGGAGGTDSLFGGLGDDTYVLGNDNDDVTSDAGGTDTITSTVSRSLAPHGTIEVLKLIGNGNIDGTGNGLANTINGNSGKNTLDGGVDAVTDFLAGGQGDDTYVLGTGSDVVIEVFGGGSDTITSTITRSLVPYGQIENLTLLGSAHIDGTGNGAANRIVGNDGQNILDGGGGLDTLEGGNAKDTYVLGNGNDVTFDTGGTDTITSTISRSLAPHGTIENLILLGNGNIDGTGNALANTITGNSGANVLSGGSDSYSNVDTLIGGAGDDTYVLSDQLDVVVEVAGGGTDKITSASGRDLADYAQVENLTLVGSSNVDGRGNALANVITGNVGKNTLTGRGGVDSLYGGAGDDTYVLGADSDFVQDTSGWDVVESSVTRSLTSFTAIEGLRLTGTADISGTGDGFNNVIWGNSGNNTLNGGAGGDNLLGAAGADTLIGQLDSNSDTLEGQDGDDLLIGGTGDYFRGGAGDDTYVLGSFAFHGTSVRDDQGGIDLATSTISRNLQLMQDVENLTLLGSADIDGTGSALDNVLTGNSGKNTLKGLAGDDTLVATAGIETLKGGVGNDTYVLGSHFFNTGATLSTVQDDAGVDTITSTIDRALTNFTDVENLILLGNANLNGTGSALDNKMIGNAGKNTLSGFSGRDDLDGGAGNDILRGGEGADKMTGGAGGDVFDYNTVSEIGLGADRDIIRDFVHLVDDIDLSTIDANGSAPGDTAFTFIGSAAFTGAKGQLRFFQNDLPGTQLDKTFVDGDVNGDGVADFRIQLTGLVNLTGSDFAL